LYTEELAGMRKNHGDDHPDTLTSMNNLVRLYKQQGKHARPTWMPDHGVTQVGAAALGPVGYTESTSRVPQSRKYRVGPAAEHRATRRASF
jgi:hypothetical protein